jgi:hypothetical protein
MVNGPVLIFGPTWLAFRYAALIQKKYAFINRGFLFGLLSLLFVIVTSLEIFFRR